MLCRVIHNITLLAFRVIVCFARSISSSFLSGYDETWWQVYDVSAMGWKLRMQSVFETEIQSRFLCMRRDRCEWKWYTYEKSRREHEWGWQFGPWRGDYHRPTRWHIGCLCPCRRQLRLIRSWCWFCSPHDSFQPTFFLLCDKSSMLLSFCLLVIGNDNCGNVLDQSFWTIIWWFSLVQVKKIQ